ASIVQRIAGTNHRLTEASISGARRSTLRLLENPGPTTSAKKVSEWSRTMRCRTVSSGARPTYVRPARPSPCGRRHCGASYGSRCHGDESPATEEEPGAAVNPAYASTGAQGRTQGMEIRHPFQRRDLRDHRIRLLPRERARRVTLKLGVHLGCRERTVGAA